MVPLRVSVRGHLPGDRHGRYRCHLHLQHSAADQGGVPGAAGHGLGHAACGSYLLEGPQGQKKGEKRRGLLQLRARHPLIHFHWCRRVSPVPEDLLPCMQ